MRQAVRSSRTDRDDSSQSTALSQESSYGTSPVIKKRLTRYQINPRISVLVTFPYRTPSFSGIYFSLYKKIYLNSHLPLAI